MTALYVISAVLIVIAVVALFLLGMSAAASLLLGTSLGVRWLAPRAFRVARRALEVAVATVRDVRAPSGRHRRIGNQPPAVVHIPLCEADTTELVVINPDLSPRKAA